MGAVIGRETGEVLPYKVISTTNAFEIREYLQHPSVQVPWQSDSKSTFMTLAGYIGAFEDPQNKQSKKIAMTTPVECLVDRQKYSAMRFFPPKDLPTADSLPQPLSPSVVVSELPKRYMAVRRFSGAPDLNDLQEDPTVRPQLLHLFRALLDGKRLEAEGPCGSDEEVLKHIMQGKFKDAVTKETTRWSLAAYNPPFCLPFLRRNEIWVEISEANAMRKNSS